MAGKCRNIGLESRSIPFVWDHVDSSLRTSQRPPYGDLDNRVRMIALEVFGLISVVWNADSR
jgi:hypothetical protein